MHARSTMLEDLSNMVERASCARLLWAVGALPLATQQGADTRKVHGHCFLT
jgi:hydroxyethylthiazole kinase-like sugar kinase family protein